MLRVVIAFHLIDDRLERCGLCALLSHPHSVEGTATLLVSHNLEAIVNRLSLLLS